MDLVGTRGISGSCWHEGDFWILLARGGFLHVVGTSRLPGSCWHDLIWLASLARAGLLDHVGRAGFPDSAGFSISLYACNCSTCFGVCMLIFEPVCGWREEMRPAFPWGS